MSRRWLRQLLILVLVIFVAIPTVLAVSTFARMAFYISGARELRLEEFNPALPVAAPQQSLLQRRIITRGDYWRVVLAMPPVPDASTYVLQIMCYEPHHRIIVISRDGTAHEVEICFLCRKMRVDASAIGGTPFVWQYTVQSLFAHYGMPERSVGEYSRLRSAAPNQTMQPTAKRPYAKISLPMNAARNSRGGSSLSR